MNLVVRFMLGGDRIAVSAPATTLAKDLVARVAHQGRAGGRKAHALFFRGRDVSHCDGISEAGVEDGDSLLLVELDEPRVADDGGKRFDGCSAELVPFLRRFYTHDPSQVVGAADALRQWIHATTQGVQLLAQGNALHHVCHLLRFPDCSAVNVRCTGSPLPRARLASHAHTRTHSRRIARAPHSRHGQHRGRLGEAAPRPKLRSRSHSPRALERHGHPAECHHLPLQSLLLHALTSHVSPRCPPAMVPPQWRELHALTACCPRLVMRHDLFSTLAHVLESAPHIDPPPFSAVDFRALRVRALPRTAPWFAPDTLSS